MTNDPKDWPEDLPEAVGATPQQKYLLSSERYEAAQRIADTIKTLRERCQRQQERIAELEALRRKHDDELLRKIG